MAMQYDVKSAEKTSSGSVFAGPARLKALTVSYASGGTVEIKDGGSGGTTRMTLNTPAVAEMFNALLPAEGVRFTTDVYVDVTNVASVTVFYG